MGMGDAMDWRQRRTARRLVLDAIHDEIEEHGNGVDLGRRVEARLRGEYGVSEELITTLLRLLVILLPLFISDRTE